MSEKELLEERLSILNMLMETNDDKIKVDKIKADVIKFIETNKNNVNTNIEHVKRIYEEVVNLKAELTVYDDIKNYGIKNAKELNNLQKEEKEIKRIQKIISSKNKKDRTILEAAYGNFDDKFNVLDNKINKLYKNYINLEKKYNINYNNSFLIKYCEILNILQDKRDRLLDIYKEFVSEDFVEELLFQLYEKKIDL